MRSISTISFHTFLIFSTFLLKKKKKQLWLVENKIFNPTRPCCTCKKNDALYIYVGMYTLHW